MKICSKCNCLKDFSCFNKRAKSNDGLRPDCKDCRKNETKNYRENNKEKIKSDNYRFYTLKKDERKEYHNKWREKNREKLRQYSKELYRKNIELNRKKRAEYVRNKANSDYEYKLKMTLRTRIKMFFKSNGKIKTDKTISFIGCDYETAKKHIESKFIDGMGWHNMGKWHIDHIKPLCLAKTESDLYELCNYKNLQPLWAKDNLIKGAKY